MAKEFAKSFYNSTVWKQMRRYILRRDRYTCEDCKGRATEVHHEVELTPDNIHDAKIALNPQLLHSKCHDCHTKTTKCTREVADGFQFDDSGQLVPIPPGATAKQSGSK